MENISKNWAITNPIKKIWAHFCGDSLFRNSVYLMTGTGIMAVLGFLFWIVVARIYSTEQIGLATTLLSSITLIASLSLIGLDIGLIRFLPKSNNKNEKINTCFSATALGAVTIVLVFIIGLDNFSPKMLFIKENIYYILLFTLFAVFSTLNILIENIFISFRNAKFVLIKNSIFSVLKFIFPLFFVGFGAFGIFGSYMGAMAISVLMSLVILIKKFNYSPRIFIHKKTIEEIGRYSFGNYTANFFSALPTLVLPLMITNLLKPEITAYYYIAMMIITLLYVIPGATSQSLFAEGSNNENEMKLHIKKAVKTITLLMVPAIFITVFFGKYILLVFGKEYSSEGLRFLQILALSGIFVSINSVFGAILRVEHKIKEMILINFVGALMILGLSYLFISKGLLGVGIAWITGQGIMSMIYSVHKKYNRYDHLLSNTA
jgi:O-antigen/teichoic acid export membrane protein